MYEIVIVPLDGSAQSERALTPAVALARASGAALEVLQVATDSVSVTDAHRYLDEVAGRITDVPVRPPIVIEASMPPECIANAGEAPSSIIVLSSHGSGGLRRAFLGSVAEDVLHQLGQPILLVGPEARLDDTLAGTVLVCSDGSPASEAVLPVAEQWCRQFGLEPTFLSVLDPSSVPTGAAGSEPSTDTLASSHVERLGREWTAAGLTAQWDVVADERPADVIVDRAGAPGVALIAMATHGRTGLARVALGSVAAHVVRHAPCPVLLTRPTPSQLA
jgi:nucleotide-binding universal stress UspA family protein